MSTKDKGKKTNRGDGGRGRSKSGKRGQSKNKKYITCWNSKENGQFKNQCTKPSADKGKKEVNVEADFRDDVLIYCIENSIESWIMDSGVLFHVNHSRSIMRNFRHYGGEV